MLAMPSICKQSVSERIGKKTNVMHEKYRPINIFQL